MAAPRRTHLRGRPAGHGAPPTDTRCYVCGPEPGLTARCPGCAPIALRVVTQPEYLWLQLGGEAGASPFPPWRPTPGVLEAPPRSGPASS
ncbi:DUF6510 family protein [Streptomyces rubiginosohelvolus]